MRTDVSPGKRATGLRGIGYGMFFQECVDLLEFRQKLIGNYDMLVCIRTILLMLYSLDVACNFVSNCLST